MAVCRHEGTGGDAVVAEVLLVDLTAILILTPEFQSLTLHGANSFGSDTDQSCEPNYNVLLVSS